MDHVTSQDLGEKTLCPLCRSGPFQPIFTTDGLPVFQNKVYDTKADAQSADTGRLALVACESCGFVFNACFNPENMRYDARYQNEQALSPYFDAYLNERVRFFKEKGFSDKNIVEIGCGKGVFLEKMWAQDFSAIGFDPAYEGNDKRIVKDYFSDKYTFVKSDLIILRHVLEHIGDPLDFIHQIAKAVRYRGKIFIEVPSFEWIVRNRAFWDIFYEHCNYFTAQSLISLFTDAEHEYIFNGQYMYVLADLKNLRHKVADATRAVDGPGHAFRGLLHRYQSYVREHDNLMVWGAGAKGTTFVNMTDPSGKHIDCVVDINPKKQNKFVACTGHRVVSPDDLDGVSRGRIIIMNDNYTKEIKTCINNRNLTCHVLGDIMNLEKN